MRKLLFIASCLTLATFFVNILLPSDNVTTRDDILQSTIDKASRKYCNCDMGDIPYLSIMERDITRCGIGHVTFAYNGVSDFELECYADSVRHNYTARLDITQIARRDNASVVRKCHDGYILAGDLRDTDGITVQGYNYYRKFICRNGRWIVYGLNYKDTDKPALARLFSIVDSFSVAVIS